MTDKIVFRRRWLLWLLAGGALLMTSTVIDVTSAMMESKVAIAGTHCGKGRYKQSVSRKENLHFLSKKQHPNVF